MDGSETSRSLPPTYPPDFENTCANASILNPDPFKFSHGLTGVDQKTDFHFVRIGFVSILVLAVLKGCSKCFTKPRIRIFRQLGLAPQQNSNSWMEDRFALRGRLQRDLVYAPMRLGGDDGIATTRGMLDSSSHPTRLQTLLVCLYLFSNFICCLAIRDQPRAQRFAELRGRCGTFATFNLILTILFALRNNPLIWLLHVSYDTFNFFHRWTARLVVLQSIAHVFAFGINAYHVRYNGQVGWQNLAWIVQQSPSYQWALWALLTFLLMAIHSVSPLRHTFYETFLSAHRLGAVVAIAGVFFHVGKHRLPQLPWVYLVISLLALEYFVRLIRIVYFNLCWKKRTWTEVSIEALPGEATRVTFVLPGPWYATPGSHVHIYLPRIGWWSSHPFSVAWAESSGYARLSQEKLPLSVTEAQTTQEHSTISCIVRARNGMTRSLYNLASSGNSENIRLWGAVEGPYGGYHSLGSYGVVVLFAGGVGITHQLSFVRHLLARYDSSTIATQNILLVWSIATIDAYYWIEPWLEEIAAMPQFQDVVRIRLHVSSTASVELGRQLLPSYIDLRTVRCDPEEVLDEILNPPGTTAVSVCGPPSLSARVRAAVRQRVCAQHIDLFDESFTY